jgi:hypothetical protein
MPPVRARKPTGSVFMAKRTEPHPARAAHQQGPEAKGRPGIVHTSLYLPEALYEGLREAAFRERRAKSTILCWGG